VILATPQSRRGVWGEEEMTSRFVEDRGFCAPESPLKRTPRAKSEFISRLKSMMLIEALMIRLLLLDFLSYNRKARKVT
jgi:hypothetical protein